MKNLNPMRLFFLALLLLELAVLGYIWLDVFILEME